MADDKVSECGDFLQCGMVFTPSLGEATLEPFLRRGAVYGVFPLVGFILSTASTLGSGVAEHYTRQAEPGISQVSSPGTLTILSYRHTAKHTHPDTLLTLFHSLAPRNFSPRNTTFPSHTDTHILIQTLLRIR